MTEITVRTGRFLFQFNSFEQWVNKAASWFSNEDLSGEECICVDANGRICRTGVQFMRARDEGSFPIKVYIAVIE